LLQQHSDSEYSGKWVEWCDKIWRRGFRIGIRVKGEDVGINGDLDFLAPGAQHRKGDPRYSFRKGV
jgi:hypothetical protein